MQAVSTQFGHPRGLVGQLIGMVMAAENRERIEWAVQQLSIQPADHVLEIGFGPGLGIQQAAALASQGASAGVDISDVMVKQARRRNAAGVQAGRVELRQGSAMDIPFADSRFDKVFTINSLHHWPDGETGLTEMRRVLKPGGTAAVIEQPPAKISDETLMRQRGEVIVRALEKAGFQDVQAVYAALGRGMAVCVLAKK